jgi:two-component system response regulator YesN
LNALSTDVILLSGKGQRLLGTRSYRRKFMYKILITDDEKDERDVILFLLKKYDFKLDILQVSNGKDAFYVLMNENIDIIFTDIQMPFLNGLELAKKAKSIDPNIEIIFFSGYDDFEYVKTALSLHAVNYILKPVNPEEFKKSISEIINIIDTREKAKKESDIYINEHFFLKYQQQSTSNTLCTDTISIEQDSLKNIAQSILLKNPETLRQNVYLILEKYKDITNVSHIYMRYLCTTILQLLFNALPEAEEYDFTKIAEEIYTFRHFSDVSKYIEGYLEKVIHQIELEILSPNHTSHLIEQYIHSHYREELSLNTLSGIVFLSPKYLSSMFVQVTGINLNKYIKNVRMNKAQELLLKTNMKISDICQETGYSNVSYFCKSFKEDFGVTPDKYRQNKGNRA